MWYNVKNATVVSTKLLQGCLQVVAEPAAATVTQVAKRMQRTRKKAPKSRHRKGGIQEGAGASRPAIKNETDLMLQEAQQFADLTENGREKHVRADWSSHSQARADDGHHARTLCALNRDSIQSVYVKAPVPVWVQMPRPVIKKLTE